LGALVSESVYPIKEDLQMNNQLDMKRITIFLAFAFGIAWLIGLVIYLTGGLVHSPEIIPGSGITLSLVLLACGYMWAPTWAHLLTRLITREGWHDTYLRPRRHGWLYWIVAWFIPSIMTILGAVLFFVVFRQYFDPSLKVLHEMLAKTGQAIPNAPWTIVIIQTLLGVLIAPFINSLFTFGEEFGWRAYLQPKLMPLGGRKAILLIGLIWGVWHWPIIAMGHNYGLDYPAAPWLGMLMMVWVTIGLGTFLGWLTVRAGNVWPAVIGHAAINGISGLAAVCVQGNPNPLLGPYPSGLIASAAWVLLTLAILLKPAALDAGHVSPLKSSEPPAQVSQ
jgi:membrane protease YdiL (CAAX protease family)